MELLINNHNYVPIKAIIISNFKFLWFIWMFFISTNGIELSSTPSTTSTYDMLSLNRSSNDLYEDLMVNDLMLPRSLRTTATVVCLIVFILGVSGNILVPLVVCRTRELCNNSTNVFLINLSIADLLVLIVCMPTVLIELHSKPEVWMLGQFMCKTVPFVELVVAHGSILTILAISFERYYAICKPLKANYKCTNRRAVITICCLWSLALMATIPVLFGTELVEAIYIDGSVVSVCITKANATWQRIYFLVSIVAFFCLPLIILIVVYCIITRRLTSDDRRLLIASIHSSITSGSELSAKHLRSSSLSFVPSSIILDHTQKEQSQSLWHPAMLLFRGSTDSGFTSGPMQNSHQRRNSSMSQAASVARSRRQVIFMLAAVVICFFLCLLPFRLFTLWLLLVSEDDIRALSMERFYNLLYFCRVMIYVNSMLNPLLYAVVSSKFRRALMDTIIQICGLHFYCYCSCCMSETDSDPMNSLKHSRQCRQKGILANHRRKFLLIRQSTTLTTTTTTTTSSSSIKNNSIRSTNCFPHSSRYSSCDSIRGPKPTPPKSSSTLQQQNSFDSNQVSTNSEVEAQPSPSKSHIYSSQHSAEYRRKAMMQHSSRVAIIDEDFEDQTSKEFNKRNESNHLVENDSIMKKDPESRNVQMELEQEEDWSSSIENIEDILNDPKFSTYESYV